MYERAETKEKTVVEMDKGRNVNTSLCCAGTPGADPFFVFLHNITLRYNVLIIKFYNNGCVLSIDIMFKAELYFL